MLLIALWTGLSGVDELVDFVAARRRLLVLTGAGISAPSGIGVYRDDEGQWLRAQPIQHADFVRDAATRKRYWARSFYGWPHFSAAQPNAAHAAIGALAESGNVVGVITQNVDRLHDVGNVPLIDLHGRLDIVRCLDCQKQGQRADWQETLASVNPWLGADAFRVAPDGDADLLMAPEDIARFSVPSCSCGGIIKPDVVFFGDSVPKERVQRAYALVDASDGLLVVGSSLMVFSSYRFCRRADASGIPMAAVNLGRTRADEMLSCKVHAACEQALPQLVEQLPGSYF